MRLQPGPSALLLSGKGKGRGNQRARLEQEELQGRGGGHPYLLTRPGWPHFLPALTLAKPPYQCCPQERCPRPVPGCITALCKGAVEGRVVAGDQEEARKAESRTLLVGRLLHLPGPLCLPRLTAGLPLSVLRFPRCHPKPSAPQAPGWVVVITTWKMEPAPNWLVQEMVLNRVPRVCRGQRLQEPTAPTDSLSSGHVHFARRTVTKYAEE